MPESTLSSFVYAADICFGLVLMVVQKETSVLETQQVTSTFVEVTFNLFVFWISNNTKLNKYKFVFNHY